MNQEITIWCHGGK